MREVKCKGGNKGVLLDFIIFSTDIELEVEFAVRNFRRNRRIRPFPLISSLCFVNPNTVMCETLNTIRYKPAPCHPLDDGPLIFMRDDKSV